MLFEIITYVTRFFYFRVGIFSILYCIDVLVSFRKLTNRFEPRELYADVVMTVGSNRCHLGVGKENLSTFFPQRKKFTPPSLLKT